MTKNLGAKPYLFPMPTYMIGTYNEDDTVDVMMMAWGGICAEDMVALNLEAEHKTVANINARKAFTLAVPGTDTLRESDFFGIATANRTADKFGRSATPRSQKRKRRRAGHCGISDHAGMRGHRNADAALRPAVSRQNRQRGRR